MNDKDNLPKNTNNELTALQKRLAELEQENAQLKGKVASLENIKKKFDFLFTSNLVGIVIFDFNTHTVLDMNDRFAEISGHKREAAIGKNTLELGFWEHENDRDEVLRILEEQSSLRDRKFRFKTRSGNIRHGNLSAMVFQFDGKRLLIASIVLIDKNLQLDVENNEQQQILEAIINSAEDSIFIKDKDRRYTFINPAMEKLLGLSAKYIIGKTAQEIFDEEAIKSINEADDPAFQGKVVSGVWTINVGPNRHSFHVVEAPLRDREGNIDKICGIVRDITELNKAHEDLKESEEKFRTIGTAALDAVVLMDPDGNATFWNPAAEKMFGYSTEEIISKNIHEILVPEKYLAQFRKGFADFQKTGTGYAVGKTLELTAKRKDGTEFPIEIAVATVLMQGKFGAVATIRDISNRKLAEEEKRRMEQQLEQAERLKTVGVLAGGIAHDINNILQIIFTNTYMLQSELDADHPGQDMVMRILRVVKRAADLVDQVLAFSRTGEMDEKPFMLKTIVQEGVELLTKNMPDNIQMRTKLTSDDRCIQGEPGRIHRVLINLATNSIAAMADTGGILDIELDVVDFSEKIPQELGTLSPNRYFRLKVIDTGHGIHKETLSRVFEPFFSTKEVGKGTGLGLSVVHGIVTSHGGAVTAESEVGKGSTFTVYFPISKETESPSVSDQEEHTTGKGSILFVDDDPEQLNLANIMLKKAGYDVTTADGGQEAIRILESDPTAFDVLIADQNMPAITGIDLVRSAQKLSPDTKSIIITGRGDYSMIRKAKEVGAVGFIKKPFSPQSIKRAIEEALNNDNEVVGS